MPIISRVLHPASKRKPPVRRHGSTSRPQYAPSSTSMGVASGHSANTHTRGPPTRTRRSGCTHALSSHSSYRESAFPAQLLSSFRTTCTHPQPQTSTFSDLYPVFRFILESRYGHTHQRDNHCLYSTAAIARQFSLNNSDCFTKKSSSTQIATCSWKNSSEFITRRHYTSSRIPTANKQRLTIRNDSGSLSARINPLSLSIHSGARRSALNSSIGHVPIPSRAISQHHSTRTLEDISGLRIPEEFLPIESTQRHVSPLSSLIFKNWVVSQISHARELFQKQNYMQALVVIDNFKDHEYMHEFSTNPSLATKTTRHHLQDLYLVEFCCRLVCEHEDQMGNIDILTTLESLNSSVLKSIQTLQTRSRTEFRTTFQLYQDPFVDYTLAILTRYWSRLMLAQESWPLSPEFSTEQASLASAALPVLRAIMNRRLFPSSTSVLTDLTTADALGSSSRRAVLEMCLVANDSASAMHWVWLWDRRDRKDWLDQWNQPDIRQWLVGHFLQSDRPDWAIDLVRLANRSSATPQLWIQDLVFSISNISSSVDLKGKHALEEILRLSDMDTGAFVKKKQYYNLDSWSRLDHLQSWLSGLQNPKLEFSCDKHLVEHRLGREMAMVGVLSGILSREDIAHSVGPGILATICSVRPPIQYHSVNDASAGPSYSDLYRDALTDYLEEKTNKGLGTILLQNDQGVAAINQKSSESLSLLKRAIQQIMFQHQPEDSSAPAFLVSYRDLLLNVGNRAALRTGHLGIVSEMMEMKFRSLFGDTLWNQTERTFLISGTSSVVNRHLQDCSWRDSWISTAPEVRDFVNHHMRSVLAKMCASSIEVEGAPMMKWEGRLSTWFMTLAETSAATGPMARALQCQARLRPGSHAYEQTIRALIDHKEFDSAIALHSYAYRLFETKSPLSTNTSRPAIEELGMLVRKLAISGHDSRHLDKAQWIFDQHLAREKFLAESGRAPQGPLIDIQTVTELVGAWSRRAEFSKAGTVLEIMWEHGIRPTMVLYNTLLKSLVDLTPYSRSGRRAMGLGKRTEMRELGRKMMVQQLITSKDAGGKDSGVEDSAMEQVKSKLEDGWNLFQSIVSKAAKQTSGRLSLPTNGLDAPSVLKRLITQTAIVSRAPHSDVVRLNDGHFRPDSYTFSILLGALAQRGEIESISDLFVEMKQLGLEPDVVICSILANAFAKRGDLKAVDRVIQEARIRNLDPGLYLTNVVLDSLVEKGVSASKIRETLDGMVASALQMKVQDLDDETEIPVRRLSGAHPQRQTSAPKRTQGSTDRSSGMSFGSERGVDAVTLTTLIKYHTRQNDLQSAQHLLQLMVQAGLVPDNRAYVLLLAACIRKKDITVGLSTVRATRMYSKEFPDAKAWKGLLRCALEMEKQGLLVQGRRQRDTLSGFSRFSSSTGSASINGNTMQHQDGYVISVLKELSSVLQEMKMDQTDPMPRYHGAAKALKTDSAIKAYLSEILTTSWLSTSNKADEDKDEQILNAEVKGKNGLLRRLLNHLLRESGSSKGGPGSKQDEDELLEQATAESAVEIEHRCEQAIWLVRLVESSGIKLGVRWKRDVIVPRIHSLTGRTPALIVKQLGRQRDLPKDDN